jgi:hypothetical protein
VQVEKTGIAGGQRSILDKELIDAGQARLIPQVDIQVQVARDQGGKVCQVTPVADSCGCSRRPRLRFAARTRDALCAADAREAMRRLRGGEADKNFTPGYASILCGEGGLVKDPVDAGLQRQALLEKGQKRLAELAKAGAVPAALATELAASIGGLVDSLLELAAPLMNGIRLAEVEQRISQLVRARAVPWLPRAGVIMATLTATVRGLVHQQDRIKKNPVQRESLALKIKFAPRWGGPAEIRTIEDREARLREEATKLRALVCLRCRRSSALPRGLFCLSLSVSLPPRGRRVPLLTAAARRRAEVLEPHQ